jgi:DNA-binding NarL/FixJ family response regulator
VVWHDGERGDDDGARARRWAAALQTFRNAVDVYRHALELQAHRHAHFNLPRQPALTRPLAEQPLPEDESSRLTRREWEVARLIARGFTNRDIAETLVVAHGTVANHVAHILGKLSASNRTQIAAYYLRVSAEDKVLPEIGDGWSEERIRRVG